MPFVFEYITPGSPVEHTPEHQQAVALKRGLPIGSRVTDPSQGAVLYCLSVGDNEQRPPGEYLLFHKGQLTKIRAYMNTAWVEGIGRVTTFRIYSIDLPASTELDRNEVVQVLTEALDAEGRSFSTSIAAVRIELI